MNGKIYEITNLIAPWLGKKHTMEARKKQVANHAVSTGFKKGDNKGKTWKLLDGKRVWIEVVQNG